MYPYLIISDKKVIFSIVDQASRSPRRPKWRTAGSTAHGPAFKAQPPTPPPDSEARGPHPRTVSCLRLLVPSTCERKGGSAHSVNGTITIYNSAANQ